MPDDAPAALATAPARERLLSLDAFRGLVIAGMLLVNVTWGEESWGTGLGRDMAMQLAHVAWNDPQQGITVTDLVFPWFLFIMGAAVPLSMRSKGASRPLMRLVRAARRAAVIYLLGVVLTHAGAWASRPMAWTDLASWNILQLIAAAYLSAVIVGMAPRWAWWAFIALVLIAKTVVMLAIPADWVRETLATGGVALPPRTPDMPVGHATFTHFDDVKRFLNREHVPASAGFFGKHLPGWLGMAQQWLPGAAIAMMGALTVDRLLRDTTSARARASAVVGAGLIAALLGVALGFGYRPGGGGVLGALTIPESKWFFSPAYCLIAGGTGAALLGALYGAIDVRGARWIAAPWRTFGVNALALYVGAELTFKLVISRWKAPVPGTEGGSSIPGAINAWARSALPEGTLLAWPELLGIPGSGGSIAWAALGGMAFAACWIIGWWGVCRWLDRRGIYIKA